MDVDSIQTTVTLVDLGFWSKIKRISLILMNASSLGPTIGDL